MSESFNHKRKLSIANIYAAKFGGRFSFLKISSANQTTFEVLYCKELFYKYFRRKQFLV